MLKQRTSIIAIDLILGFVFVIFNFDGFMRYSARNWSPNPTITNLVYEVSRWPAKIIPTSTPETVTFLHDVMVLCFYGVWIYLGVVTLLALIRLNPRILGSSVLGLASGASTIAILSWLGLLLIAVGGIVVAIFRFLEIIWDFIIRVLAPVWEFIASVFLAIWGFLGPIIVFLLPYITGLVLIALALWVVIEIIRVLRYKSILVAAIIGLIGYFTWPVLIIIWERFLEPVILWILTTLLWILSGIIWILAFIHNGILWLIVNLIPISFITITVGLILTIVGAAGALLVDQIRAAWHSGSGHKGVLLGSFSIGLSFALIIWVSSGSPAMTLAIDQAWQETTFVAQSIQPSQVFDAMLPDSVREVSHHFFTDTDAPNFDVIVLALILPISYFGLLRGMTKRYDDEFRATFIHKDILVVGGAIILAIPVIIFILLAMVLPRDDLTT